MKSLWVKKLCSLLLLFPLLLGGCGLNSGDKKVSHHFAIFLVKDVKTADAMKTKIEELMLETEPLITDKDVLAYEWENHELKLTNDFDISNLPEKVPLDGLPFVVIADDKRIYLGAFWTPISSLSSNVPVIEVPLILPQNKLKIEAGYPGNINIKSDPRNNKIIYDALKRIGKI